MTHPIPPLHDPPHPCMTHPTLLILWPTPPHTLTFLDPYFVAHHSMYFSNDKIVRKNFFVTCIIALPFDRWQPLLGLFHSRFTTVLLIALLDTVEVTPFFQIFFVKQWFTGVNCCFTINHHFTSCKLLL